MSTGGGVTVIGVTSTIGGVDDFALVNPKALSRIGWGLRCMRTVFGYVNRVM